MEHKSHGDENRCYFPQVIFLKCYYKKEIILFDVWIMIVLVFLAIRGNFDFIIVVQTSCIFYTNSLHTATWLSRWRHLRDTASCYFMHPWSKTSQNNLIKNNLQKTFSLNFFSQVVLYTIFVISTKVLLILKM